MDDSSLHHFLAHQEEGSISFPQFLEVGKEMSKEKVSLIQFLKLKAKAEEESQILYEQWLSDLKENSYHDKQVEVVGLKDESLREEEIPAVSLHDSHQPCTYRWETEELNATPVKMNNFLGDMAEGEDLNEDDFNAYIPSFMPTIKAGKEDDQLIVDDLEEEGDDSHPNLSNNLNSILPQPLPEEIETLPSDDVDEPEEEIEAEVEDEPGFEEKKESNPLLSFLLQISRSSTSRSADLIQQYLQSSELTTTTEEFTPQRSFTEVEEFI